MFGCETYGIRPDIITVAKQLSSAYMPIAAVLINDKVYAGLRENTGKIGTFGHGFTYSGHPVSCAVALETLKIYKERRLLDHIAEITPVFQKRLAEFADHPLVGETRGVGVVGAVEIVRDKKTRESYDPAQAVGPNCVKFCQEQGVILRAIVDSVVFCPPLIATAQEIHEMFDRFGKGLDDTAAWLKNQGLAAVA
jgi:4-aminobutyrate--pyruvate transaminase